MAVESPPWALAIGSYSAEQTRRAVFSWLARTGANSPGIVAGGLLSATDCQLTAPGSGMTVNVGVGELIVGGSEGGAQGAVYARVTSTTNLSISAANATNPRIDTVCATISDAGYTEPTGGSGNQWAPQVVTGTATATASLANLLGVATLPLSSLLLGYVLVPALSTNVITGNIANKATVVPLLAGSNVLQLPSSQKLIFSAGIVTTGNPPSLVNAGTGDWTVGNLAATGTASVNFTGRTGFLAPMCQVDTFDNANTYDVTAVASGSNQVQIASARNGVATNLTCVFYAVGF